MSLRGRLAATIALLTVVILIVGGVMSYIRAQHRIAAEMAAARSVAANGITRLIAALPGSAAPQRDLESLVRTFDGDRHVRLLLIDAFGGVRLQSHLSPPEISVPAAFERVLAPQRMSDMIPLPPNAAPVVAAMLVVVPINEIAEVWTDLVLNLGMLALFLALAFGLVFLVVGRALAPLGELTQAFRRIGRGDYAAPLPLSGPPELAALAAGCNDMAARLGAMARQNGRLSEQLLRLQDEERAELARNLHDDIGPLLFAIDVDAAHIADTAASNDGTDARHERATAIRQAARQARLEVRRILGTLRPGLLPGIGLAGTLGHLVAAARLRHPDILFRLEVCEEELGAELDAVLHRVAGEALANALRHGRPSTISITLRTAADRVSFRIADDGGGFGAKGPTGGYGLIGMRERVEATGGTLNLVEIGLPAGIAVAGFLPRPARRDMPTPGALAAGAVDHTSANGPAPLDEPATDNEAAGAFDPHPAPAPGARQAA